MTDDEEIDRSQQDEDQTDPDEDQTDPNRDNTTTTLMSTQVIQTIFRKRILH